jgi:hypothetical protein
MPAHADAFEGNMVASGAYSITGLTEVTASGAGAHLINDMNYYLKFQCAPGQIIRGKGTDPPGNPMIKLFKGQEYEETMEFIVQGYCEEMVGGEAKVHFEK